MVDERNGKLAEDEDPVTEIEIEDTKAEDLDEAMQEAVAAVEAMEERADDQRQVIDRLEREVADLRDRSVRTLADFENFRKRASREQKELRRYAVTELVRDLLSVLDNLERALAAGGSVEDLKQGVEMIQRQLQDVLRRQGVRAVEAENKPFDPTVHEAVSRREDDSVDEPVVTQEMQRGYLLHERLVRPAIVEVAMPPDPDGPPTGVIPIDGGEGEGRDEGRGGEDG